ncbi:arf-GAP domain and FG repeat-containing protein 1 [Anopheles ziemanni]|uniref:arf-GAP domain and FG repeat-containing protein 1 n=1 Tax=Anopheles coustani TaxID=139045 RepID=UPI00265AF549|nr:arf-GAP domain and FG repeat-containing protein 1 [Anopheles coustani]XP_058168010.1 arf-GAP domain and FG repeat-containing protein 1 [Anopheles ziemanni]
MALVRKKLDDKILKTLRELVAVGGNKECFDCGQKGPTYINMTIGSFVCTSCSGILRGLTPPHRVKSISMATFTQEEIEFLKQNGNDNCSRTWLGLWDPKRAIKQEHRDFMIDKYEKQRYYLEPASPLKSLPTNASSSLTSLSVGGGSSNKNANESLVPLKTPTLTPPPAKLRLNRNNSGSCNGLNTVNSSSSIVAPAAAGGATAGVQFQQQFSPDDSGFFGSTSADPPKILPPTPQKGQSALQRKNGIKIKGGAAAAKGQLPPTFERNQKNGLLNNSSTGGGGFAGSSGDINANKFTPDGDFVADFGSANIVNNVSNGGSHYGSTSSLKNGSSSENGSYGQHNGLNGKASAREMENFADFDHNPIFNSAENMKSYFSSNSFDSSTTNSVSSTASVQSLTGSDPFANFYSHTLAGNCSNAGSNAGTPTASSSGTGPSAKYGTAGYTCMSPEDNLHTGKPQSRSYGFGNTFTTETRFSPNANSIQSGPTGAPFQYHLPSGGPKGPGSLQENHPLGNGNSLGCTVNANHFNNNSGNEDTSPNETVQWNFWQQFGNSCWPAEDQFQQQQQPFRNNHALQMTSPQHAAAVAQTTNYRSDQYRWSLPMPLGATGSNGNLNGTNNGNTSMHSTPSVDRYAALKDLDEQFREIKLEQQAEANNNTVTSNGITNGHGTADPHASQVSTANPFKTANPFQQLQQQQQQQQQQTMAWPVNGMNGGTPRDQALPNGAGFYATSPYQGGFVHGSSPQLYNGTPVANGNVGGAVGSYLPTGYHQPNGNGYAMAVGGPNGGLHAGQFNATLNGVVPGVNSNPVHHFGNFGNPFMATGTTAGSSNNPFL